MFFSSSLLLLATAAAVQATVYDVQVGSSSGTLAFSPEAIVSPRALRAGSGHPDKSPDAQSAQPGDQVVFHFQQKNHTATRSSFASPCGALEGGFDSGL